MKYYFIYSAGGGAGDWNGIKRIWKNDMPIKLKQHILLKFGDIFFNHKSSHSILRPTRWNQICNLREWLFENVNDDYVIKQSEILLDSGTAKIVNFIEHNYNLGNLSTSQLIDYFKRIIDENNVIEKYVDIVVNSKINYAVGFDIPNPFKVRSSNAIVDRRINVLEENSELELINVSALYTNQLFTQLSNKIGEENARNILMPVINGTWTKDEFHIFLEKLEFVPINIAIGGISNRDANVLQLDLKNFELHKYKKVHFLGCGGLSKTKDLKTLFNGEQYSVDVSTPINRAIDGSTNGSKYSGIYSYNSLELLRINEVNKNIILEDYKNATIEKIFSQEKLEEIINSILLHQSGQSNTTTYDNRARIIILNSDVFRYNAEL